MVQEGAPYVGLCCGKITLMQSKITWTGIVNAILDVGTKKHHYYYMALAQS